MPRLLAIDWDQRELAFVVATVNRDQVTLEAAETIALTSTGDEPAISPEEIGKKLKAALSVHKPSGAMVLITVDRHATEMFEFTVPPASDAELPELVLNQVTMESSSVTEDSVIDFIAGQTAGTEPRRVMALVLPGSELARIKAVCHAAGLTPQKIVARSYATASLFPKSRTAEAGAMLLVNVIGDEVDLIAIHRAQPVFSRTLRLPGIAGDESAEQRLLSEIRRTVLVAPQGAEGPLAIGTVSLFGTAPASERLVQQLSASLDVKVDLVDPLEGIEIGADREKLTSGRFVPLLGMAAEEARGGQHAVDFLHPRRAPQRRNRTRQLIVGASVATLLLCSGGYYLWSTLAKADAENQELADQLKDLEGLVKKTAEKKKVIDAIAEWDANGIVWLDELRDLSAKFPSGQELVLQRLSMSPSRGGKASISFQGLAREPEVVSRMESTLRDDRHEVQTPRVEERTQDKSYTWNFETSVSLTPPKPNAESAAEPDQPQTPRKGTNTKLTKNSSSRSAKSQKPTKDRSRKAADSPSSTEAAEAAAAVPESGKDAPVDATRGDKDSRTAQPDGGGNMNQFRQRLLYFALGAIVLFMGGEYVLRNFVDAPLEQRQSRKEQLEKKIQKKKKELAEIKQGAKKLAALEAQSLPNDTEVARSLYRSWLLELVGNAGFQTPHVDSGPASNRKGFYETLAFSVRGKGTLDQVTQFLFNFYRAGHLHKIQSLSLSPVGKSGGLEVALSIEALILPGTERKDQLATATSNRLHYTMLADYRIISRRNLFGAGGELDPSRHAFLTAVTKDSVGPEIWFTLRTQDKLLKLHKGDAFQIGHFNGTVVDILEDDVIFESVGERWLLSIGEPLAEAFALPPEF